MRKLSGKFLSILMSVTLAVGLMPLPAYAGDALQAAGIADVQGEVAADSSGEELANL